MLNFVFISIILAVAAWAMQAETRATRHYQTVELELVAKAIAELENNAETISRNQVRDRLWRWFCQHLAIESSTEDLLQPQRDRDRYILLSYPSILSQSVPRSPVAFAPTLLTALGVLGTFAGIYLGLQGVSLEATTDADKLLSDSTQLLGNMKVAFSTSLAGLGTASLLMLLLSDGERRRRNARNQLRKKLDRVAFLETPNRLLSRLHRRDDGEAVKALAAVAENVTALTRITPESLGRSMAKSLAAELTPVVELLGQQLLSPVSVRLQENADLLDKVSRTIAELKTTVSSLSREFAASEKNIHQFQTETVDRLHDFLDRFANIAQQFQAETRDSMEKVSTQLEQAVKTSVTTMEAQRTAFDSSAKTAAATFSGIRQELEAALETQAKLQSEMLQNIEKQTRDILTDSQRSFAAQSDNLVTVGDETAKTMNEARESLLRTLENVDAMLQDTHNLVEGELEKFRLDYRDALQTFLSEQNHLLVHTLGRQREGLEKVVSDLDRVFQEEIQRRREANR